MIAEIDPGSPRILLDSEYREKELVKLIPGSRFEKDYQGQVVNRWWVPLSWAACVQLRAVFGEGLRVGPVLDAWAREQLDTRINPCLELRRAEDTDVPFLEKLYPFQRAGAVFMAAAGQALNSDEMGLGKTVQTISAIEYLGVDAYPVLIVCPNSMKFPWAEEFARWSPGRTTAIVTGTPKKRLEAVTSGADVIIINYEALRGYSRLSGYGSIALEGNEAEPKELNSIAFGTVVADEAHRAMDPTSKQTRALWWVGSQAKYRFGLTGTPTEKSPADIWAIMRFVAPAEYPVKGKFIERYAQETVDVYGYPKIEGLKAEHSDELFRFFDPRFIRRLKVSVAPQLPEKVYTTRLTEPIGSQSKQGKAYRLMRDQMLADLDGGILIAANSLVQQTRLIQFASAYAEIDLAGDVIMTEPSCKVDALEEILEEIGDQQVVVFAESRQLIEIASKRLVKASGTKDHTLRGIRTGMVTGAVPEHERAQNVQDFQRGLLKVLLVTLGAGGEGLTLTAASTAVFLQRSWSHRKNLQAEDRVHRIGQDADSVTIIDVITPETIEDDVHAARAVKADMMEEIARDEETLRHWLRKKR